MTPQFESFDPRGDLRNLSSRLQTVEAEMATIKAELAAYKETFVVSPTKLTIRKSVLVDGLFNSDRVYTQRTGSYVELTT
jgi:hypothetical protein